LRASPIFRQPQKDFGLAASTSTRLFNKARELADQMLIPAEKQSLQSLLVRDHVTARLAFVNLVASSKN
jgi:hypothetical protein